MKKYFSPREFQPLHFYLSLLLVLLFSPALLAEPYGKAHGAGYYDTSLYMAGEIAVGIFFQNHSDGWTESEMDQTVATIQGALDGFIEDEPNANITFIYVDERGTPLPSSKRGYVNDLRNLYNTHWAFMIIVRKVAGNSAYLFGPSLKIWVNNLSFLRHETGHIFGAGDQYLASNSPTARFGYLNVVNANAIGNSGGYFNGKGEGLPDLMKVNSNKIGAYSRGQFGWRDQDGDGVLDPLDTFADSQILSRSGTHQFHFSGQAEEQALKNERGGNFGDVTLNTISGVEYRINGLSWLPADPLDGQFDTGLEGFEFTTPELPSGSYTVEIRATNSVNNRETSYAHDTIDVGFSPVINAAPFPSFSVKPTVGSLTTSFRLDATSSTDLETQTVGLNVRWDFEGDGIWDSPFSRIKNAAVTYPTAGEKTILVEVKDANGNTAVGSQSVTVVSENLPPLAAFSVTPESQHGVGRDTFDIGLNPVHLVEPENPSQTLQVRWDFEDDGIWDTPYTAPLSFLHSYPLPTTPTWLGNYLASNCNDVHIEGPLAYLACNQKMLILDVSNPASPRLVGTFNTVGTVYSVFLEGTLAYLVGQNNGLEIVDVQNPANPVLLGGTSVVAKFAKDICVANNIAYVADGYNGMRIIDVSNPANPTLLATHPRHRRTTSVTVADNKAYLLDTGFGTNLPAVLEILDINNPAAPVLLGSVETIVQGVKLRLSGTYAYVANWDRGLQIFDVSNPSAPFLLSEYGLGLAARDVYIVDSKAYLALYDDGVQIIDITDPTAPAFDGAYQPVTGMEFSAAYATSDKLYALNKSYGLDILDLTNMQALARTFNWRIRMEAKDSQGLTSQAVRDVWTNTYNSPPQLDVFPVVPVKLAEIDTLASLVTDEYFYGIALADYSANSLQDSFSQGTSLSSTVAYCATVASGDGKLYAIDVANPATPTIIGTADTPGRAYGVALNNQTAYVADGHAGLALVDISNPQNPTLIGGLDTPDNALAVAVAGSVAYVADVTSGLHLIDVSDPANLQALATYDTPDKALDVAVEGSIAYVADNNSGLLLIDVSDPQSPLLVGSYDASGVAKEVFVVDNLAYLIANGELHILDVTEKSNPLLLGMMDLPSSSTELYVSGALAFVTTYYYNDAMWVIDVEDPTNPNIITHYSTGGDASLSATVAGDKIYLGINGRLEILQYQLGNGAMAKATAAQDPDSATSWDGLLEYRWDADTDGVWESKYQDPNQDILVAKSLVEDIAVTLQVKDRFHAISTVRRDFHAPEWIDVPEQKTGAIGRPMTMTVSARDVDLMQQPLALTATLENGDSLKLIQAGFTDNHNGTGTFKWTPDRTMIGQHVIVFKAADGLLHDTAATTVTVVATH